MKVNRRRLSVYLAGPLFSEAERSYNEQVADELEKHFDVFLPQRDGGLFMNMVNHGVTVDDAASAVFAGDLKAMEECDLVVAVLDGRAIDEGVAFEIGYAFSRKKQCFGLQTDMRRLLPIGNNPMLTGALEQVFSSLETLLEYLRANFAPRGASVNWPDKP